VWSKDPEPLAVTGRRADGVAGGAVDIFKLGGTFTGSQLAQRRLEIDVAELGQAFASRLASGECGEALLDVTSVALEVSQDESFDRNAVVCIQIPSIDEVISQRSSLVAGPSVERGDELRLLDQAILQGEQAEQKITIGSHRALPERSFAR
jgi:hypothetical protein